MLLAELCRHALAQCWVHAHSGVLTMMHNTIAENMWANADSVKTEWKIQSDLFTPGLISEAMCKITAQPVISVSAVKRQAKSNMDYFLRRREK